MSVRLSFVVLFFCFCFFTPPAFAVKIIEVKTDFMELHTGAGRGFPVVNVLERGEVFTLLKRKYDWLKVQTSRGELGWVSYSDFLAASHLKKSNNLKKVARANWQLGVNTGIIKSDPYYSGFINYYLLPQLSVGGELGKMIGSFSGSSLYSLNGRLMFFREAIISPVLNLGIGVMDYAPRDNLLDANQHKYDFYRVGLGAAYVPYKRIALEVSLSNFIIADLNSYWSGSISASVYYD